MLDGKFVRTGALGFANLERQIPAASDTRFRIASMSKSFVAMAALRLRDEGRLRLDDPVERYLPEFRRVRAPVTDAPVITIRQLMTMTSHQCRFAASICRRRTVVFQSARAGI